MSNTEPENSIDATITAAVNARVEAEVARALSGDEVLGRYVTAALQQTVEVNTGDYRKQKVPFLSKVLHDAIQAATKRAVAAWLEDADERARLETAVVTALRSSRDEIASNLVDQVVAAADKPYGVTVELKFPNS